MSKEKLEKLEREKYVVERKLTAAMHKEKRLQSELKRLTRSGRTHRLCTRAGMLETFLKEPTTLTDDDVMELLVSAMIADRNRQSDQRYENLPRSRNISRKKIIGYGNHRPYSVEMC